MAKDLRCAGCGKPLSADTEAVRVLIGKVVKKPRSLKFSETQEWGIFDRLCFERSIDSPEVAWREVQKQARK